MPSFSMNWQGQHCPLMLQKSLRHRLCWYFFSLSELWFFGETLILFFPLNQFLFFSHQGMMLHKNCTFSVTALSTCIKYFNIFQYWMWKVIDTIISEIVYNWLLNNTIYLTLKLFVHKKTHWAKVLQVHQLQCIK